MMAVAGCGAVSPVNALVLANRGDDPDKVMAAVDRRAPEP
jgi:hypothetical protein